jgi:preprotein translocase subunit YajC
MISHASTLASLIAQNEGGGGGFLGGFDPLVMMVVIGILFYFLMIRPERRKRQETDRMLESLKKNDRVVTIGGIFGVVVNVAKDEVTIRVDENNNTRLRILRSAISRVSGADEGEEKKDTSKAAAS